GSIPERQPEKRLPYPRKAVLRGILLNGFLVFKRVTPIKYLRFQAGYQLKEGILGNV
ncbi:hypothetical protein CC77DRAFT_939130, partial [Alternaria alternata]